MVDTFQQFSRKSPKKDTEISQFLLSTIAVLVEFVFNNFLVFQCNWNSLDPDKIKCNFKVLLENIEGNNCPRDLGELK